MEVTYFQTSSFIVLAIYVIYVALSLPKGVEASCYPDTKQLCDKKGAVDGVWNSSMRFFLFTRKNHKDPEMLHMCNGRLPKRTSFNPKNKLIVFIPGFMFGTCELTVIREMKDEFLEKGDFNIILIDNRYEFGADYVEAKAWLPEIAKVIAKVLQNIQDVTGIKNDDVYIVGHSLGAQAAGLTGSLFKVHRITGLDPAGVLFPEETPPNKRLDPSDADIVDILHCSGGKTLPYLSIPYPAGHADFYINGGSDQPSCFHSAWEAIKHFDILYAVGTTTVPTLCSHAQCLEFYKLSINNKLGNFTAWDCDNYENFKLGKCSGKGAKPVLMGYDFEESLGPQRGKKLPLRKFYLQTSEKWPYFTNNGTYRSVH